MPFVGSIEGVRAFIPGAPGSGKTVDLAAHARAYIAAGQGVAAIDPKGAPRFAMSSSELRPGTDDLSSHGRRGARSPTPACSRQPTEITDKALAGEEWSEPHYLRPAQRYINVELQTMQAAGEWPPCLEAS